MPLHYLVVINFNRVWTHLGPTLPFGQQNLGLRKDIRTFSNTLWYASHTSHMKFKSPRFASNWASHFPPHSMTMAMYGRLKTPFSGGVSLLLHNYYNCEIFSICQSLIFTKISPGYTSIVGRLKITPHFSYTTFHSPSIKKVAPPSQKGAI